ncbi:MAG: hypothetical protein Q4C49_10725 [Bacillota bacterium]|nr:hypothetical protein [Bacillota bacterium]
MGNKIIYEETIDFVEENLRRKQPTVEMLEGMMIHALTDYADEETTEPEWMAFFIALGLRELKSVGITPKVEETMTYWIYQYEHFGLYQDEFEDKELLDKDIAEIKSLMHLRFENLACFEG